jgi:hypothetical protein
MTLTTSQVRLLWTLLTSTSKVGNATTPVCFRRLIIALDQKVPLDKAQLKELLYEEIVSFVPSI